MPMHVLRFTSDGERIPATGVGPSVPGTSSELWECARNVPSARPRCTSSWIPGRSVSAPQRQTETSQATKTPLTSGNVNFTNEYLETDKPVHSCLVHVNAVLHPAGAPQGPAQLAVPVTTGETTHGPEQSRCSPVHTNWGSAVLSPRYFYCQPYGQTDSLFLMLLWALFIVFFQRTMNSPFVSDQKKQLFCVLCHCLPLSYVNKPSYITAQPTWFISVNNDIYVCV